MSLKSRKELLFRMRHRYQQADRRQKTEIIEGFVAATGYNRTYAAWILARADQIRGERPSESKRRVYDEAVRQALISVWNAASQICSKRLAPFLPEFVKTLERFGHLSLPSEVRNKLLKLSPATMDRLLKQERANHPRGISTTRPANLLKQRIKVRTFAEWNETGPGFFEADLVAHCGDRAEGPFVNSLVMTDISSGWTEFVPLLRKSDGDVIAGLETIRSILPVPLLGLDTDNGCEFITYELLAYCDREMITFTRSRAYKKNDQAHIEQKNGSVIRRVVGYDRFEGIEGVTRLLRLYRVLRLYVNFFQPSCKLVRKTRVGSRTKKEYDQARTPFERLMTSDRVGRDSKQKLKQLYQALDPIDLFEQIGKLQANLWKISISDVEPGEPTRQPIVQATRPSPPQPPVPVPEKNRLLTLKPLRRFKRAYNRRMPHSWRTRKDPLDGTYDYARLLFSLEPEITSTDLLGRLKEKFPDKISGKELKTLQRRLAKWRREAMSMRVATYEDGDKYDHLPFHNSMRQLTQKALNLAVTSG